jgi:hypothetical protein
MLQARGPKHTALRRTSLAADSLLPQTGVSNLHEFLARLRLSSCDLEVSNSSHPYLEKP